MGFAISWFAVQGKEAQQVLDVCGLLRSGRTEEMPDAAISCCALPGGWFLVFANRFDSPLVTRPALEAISADCQVVSCQVEEHVMFSSASCYRNGELSWHVEHDAQKSIYHLASNGVLPAAFDAIYAGLKQEQDEDGGEKAEVDYIHDVPIALAQAVTAFRHDQDIAGAPDQPFEVLQQSGRGIMAAGRPWWKFW
jgi:hypothetical protein